MDCSSLNWVKNTKRWNYELTSNVTFPSLSGIDYGSFKAFDKESGKLLIYANKKYLTVYSGYAWDGCTGIGKVYENEKTLLASLLHDVLYQVGKQVGYNASFTLKQADKEFLWQMKKIGVSCIVRNLWYAGVASIGVLWKQGKLNQLRITPLD